MLRAKKLIHYQIFIQSLSCHASNFYKDCMSKKNSYFVLLHRPAESLLLLWIPFNYTLNSFRLEYVYSLSCDFVLFHNYFNYYIVLKMWANLHLGLHSLSLCSNHWVYQNQVIPQYMILYLSFKVQTLSSQLEFLFCSFQIHPFSSNVCGSGLWFKRTFVFQEPVIFNDVIVEFSEEKRG